MTLVITIASQFYVVPAHAQSANKPFEHSSTGYPLTGSHSSLACASCHVPGTILSTPKLCFDCHNNQAIPGKPLNHMSSDQKCEACHQTTMWSDIRRVDHADIPTTTPCATCHTGVVAMGKPANHVATTAPCQMCHSSTASFALATQFNHTGITSGCATCHDGVTATGKPANHIPTIAPCEMCHSSTVSFAIGVKFDHTGITTGCATCHNNVQALGKPSSHVPTSLPCETCHSSTVTFSIATYVHSASDTNCSSCHDGITAMGLTTPPHIPVVAVQCSNCHTNTSPSFSTYTMSHASVAGMRCDACHNGSYAGEGAKGALGTSSYAGHVATGGQDCLTCHASAAATYTSWSGAVYVHQPSDTNCSSCHNGTTATGNTTPPHIPVTGVQCSNCHTNTATSFITYTMNHAAVSASRCDACHNGSYTSQGTKGAQGTSSYAGHVATNGQDCTTCHTTAATTYTTWAGAIFVHQPTDTNCSSCHNGSIATGNTMPPHIPVTGVQCSNCHTNTATSFVTYTMNHAAVSASRCDACHNGSYTGEGTKGALGTSSYAGHVATGGQDCITCHATAATTFTTWSGAIYVHQPSDTNCSSCHNGTTATGNTTPPHIPVTGVQCSNCHTNTATSFITYTMNHAAVSASRCDACHNGSYTSQGTKGALGTSSYAGHVATGGQDCVTCHASAATTFTTWSGAIYVHQPSDTNCSSCHNGTTATGNTTPPHIPATGVQCSNCHTNTATSFITYTMNHAAVSASRCDACHNGAYTSQGTKGALGISSYAGHVATGGQDCTACHANAATTFTSWSGAMFVHQPTDTNCSSCHNGTIATGNTTPPHIPATGVQCSNCHTNTASSFATYTMSHAAVSASRCDACHNGSYTSQGTKGATGTASYAGHVATNGQDCITCHASAATTFTSWAGAIFVHQPTDTNCSSCHNGTTATGNTTPPHIPAAGVQCSNCHTNTASSFTTYTMNHAAVTGMRCDACHNGSYTSQGTRGATGSASYPNHVNTNGQDCVTCHASAATTYTSWAGGTYVHQPSDTNCSSCHNGTIALGNTTPPHIPVTGVQCSNCHTNTASSFTTYVMNHSSVSASRCDACHNGSYTGEGTKGAMGTASYPSHVNTNGQDCIVCHASAANGYLTWAGAKYVHQPTDTNCSNCHNGTFALGLTTPPHIPVTGVQCSNCHTNAAASFTTYTMNHAAVSASRCDACHNGSYTGEGTKGATGTASYAGHVATTGRDCIACHASAATTFTSWSGAVYVHQPSDTNCSSCHNGTTATGNTTPPHIPMTGVQCSNCHTNTATSFITYTMNHAAVSASRCDACHNGSYIGEGTKGATGTASYAGHVPTTGRDCITCHASAATTFTSWSGAVYVHQPSDTNCSSCHNGTTATGNTTPPHIPMTGVQCSNCHTNTATSFTTYTMNHAAVSASRCDACHNGSYTSEGTKGATGTASYPNHVATGGRDCITCHASAATTYTSWAGGTYAHQPSDTNCSNCHNGTIALGMTTPPHIPSGVVQCSNCHTNTAASFTTYTMNHAPVVGTRCDSCHNGSYTSEGTKGAMGTASYANHVATGGRDCITCHASAATTYTSWAGGTYVHLSTDTNCTLCHNGTIALGMTTPPHIPTGVIQCSGCHTNTATSFTTYTMDHTVVTSIRCDACHNGSYKTQGTKGAQAKPNDHPKVTADCGCCHQTTTWSNPKESAGTCTTTAKNPVPNAMAAVKSAISRAAVVVRSAVRNMANAVLPSKQPAVTATRPTGIANNSNPTGPAKPGPAKPAVASGPPAAGTANSGTAPKPLDGANGSSSTVTALNQPQGQANSSGAPKPADGVNSVPIKPSGAVNPPASGFSAGTAKPLDNGKFVPTAPLVAPTSPGTAPSNLIGGVNRQDGGKADLTQPAIASNPPTGPPNLPLRPGSPAAGAPANSLPQVGPGGFGKSFGANMPATGDGASKFTHPMAVSGCANCHNGRGAPGKPPKHVPSSALCENCHRSTITFAGARVDHGGLTAACATCHTGLAATGKPQRHISTNAPCETCHKSTNTFAGARLDHRGVAAPCASCHTGSVAIGKPQRHLPTTAPCETCHKSTNTFAGARIDHRGITAPCATCHTGAIALGKPPHHVQTAAPCETCHKSTVSFTGARMDHNGLTARCATCHNGRTASGTGPRHFTTLLPCESCHRSSTWNFVLYRHASPLYPNHVATIACSTCHITNAQMMVWKFPAYKPDCAACHADRFRPQAHPKVLKPVPMFYTAAELKDCTGACHIYADRMMTAIQTNRTHMHRANGGGW